MVDLTSGSLKCYCDRHGLAARTACDHFLNGLMAYMAATSWTSYQEARGDSIGQVEILDVAPRPSQECRDYAHRMIGVMAVQSHYKSFSDAVMLAAAFHSMWPDEHRDSWIFGDWALQLGFYVAAEADGCGIAWSDDDLPSHGIMCPRIEVFGQDLFDTDTDA